MKKFSALLLVLLLFCVPCSAAVPSEDIVILYTNDVHCGIDDAVGYAGVKGYFTEMKSQTPYVTLVDAGDWAQGGSVGSISQGEYLLELMNAVGYEIAVPGNHEFDYGWGQFENFAETLGCGFLSSNLRRVSDGELIFDPYKIFTYGDVKVAFVGACTPESITKSTPSYFKDAEGNYLYSFDDGNEGMDLVNSIQKAVDDAKAEGADYVIVVGHLGASGDVTPYWSTLFIAPRTNNIDAFIDAHTHQVLPEYVTQNKDGKNVIITQTGTRLQYLGKLTINTEGEISTELLSSEDITTPDPEIASLVNDINARVAATTDEVLAHTNLDLLITDGEGHRLVRNGETNLANLVTDAILDAAKYTDTGKADIALFNGGSIRNNIPAGNITYGDVVNVAPFGNTISIIETTGQTILDELEMGARMIPLESGGFFHSSGLTYVIDGRIPTPVVLDDENMFLRVSGDRRIKNVLVNGEPIDPEKKYKVIGTNYFLLDEGDGHKFYNSTVIEPAFDVEANLIAAYIRSFDEIPERYATTQGRLKVITDDEAAICTNGIFEGFVSDDVYTWLGVPYAKAPTGSLRWKAPEQADYTHEKFDALNFGPMPLQKIDDYHYTSHMPQDEDCLYLNVWKASDDSTALKPVMVWVHGGSFKSNGTGEPEYLGHNFAADNHDVIMVSVGYRTGLMGFIDFSEVPGGEAFRESGNLALLDLLQSVKWLKDNAAAFGGDPNNITLFGQSSGSAMISLLMTMPEAQGLFQRAILQSGGVSMSMSKTDATQLAALLLETTGTHNMDELMALSSRDLQAATTTLQGALNFPERDGVVLTSGDIYEAFAKNSAGFDMLIGTDADEVRYFMAAAGSLEAFSYALNTAYDTITGAIGTIPVYGEAMLEAVNNFIALQGDTETVWAYSEFFNDLLFRGPANAMALAHQGNTYMYYWDIPSAIPYFGACHASEVPYILDNPSALVPAEVLASAEGKEWLDDMQKTWVTFAKTGELAKNENYDPNVDYRYTTEIQWVTFFSNKTDEEQDELNKKLKQQKELITPLLALGISGREIVNALDSPAPTPDDPSNTDATTGHAVASTLKLDDATVESKVAGLISTRTGISQENIDVSAMPADAWGEEKTSANLTESELAALPDNETVAKVMPDAKVNQSGAYVFGVDLSGLSAGTKIAMHMTSDASANDAAAHSAADESTACVLVDENGNEVDEVPADGSTVNAVVYMEADTTYSFVLTEAAPDSGKPDSGDVPPVNPGSPSGGCNSGMMMLFMLPVVPVIVRKRH